jgi:hypothetical protein
VSPLCPKLLLLMSSASSSGFVGNEDVNKEVQEKLLLNVRK